MLTNREIATLILFGAFFAWILSMKVGRRAILDIYHAVTSQKILIVIGVYLAYALLLIEGAWHIGLWNTGLLKDTVLIVSITGLGMVFSANAIKSGTALTKKTFIDVIGLTAIIAFYVNLSSFSIPVEILMQGLLAIIAMLSVVAKHQKDIPKSTAQFFDTLLIIGGICLLIKTTADINGVWHAEGMDGVLSPLLLSIWFPLTLLPFIYALSFLMYVETMLLGLKALNDQKRISTKAYISLMVGLRFSVKYARCFTGHWRLQFINQRNLKSQLAIMKAYREDVQKHEAEERLEARRLKQYAGVEGEDEHGRRLDRREFKETCKILTDLYFYQRGMRMNRGHYFEQPLILLSDSRYYGLGENRDLAVAAHVSNNKRMWYAWRSTPSGWVFAIGGTKKPDEQWQYDGPEPPTSYPSGKDKRWTTRVNINWTSADSTKTIYPAN